MVTSYHMILVHVFRTLSGYIQTILVIKLQTWYCIQYKVLIQILQMYLIVVARIGMVSYSIG